MDTKSKNRLEHHYCAQSRFKTVHQWFEDQVVKAPNNYAITLDGINLTYGQLNDRTNQMAHCLLRYGVGPEALVGIYMERSIDMIVSILGILKAGGAYVPIDPVYPNDRIAFMIQDAGIKIVITQSDLVDNLPKNQIQTISIDKDKALFEQEDIGNPLSAVMPHNIAYIIYTSGSTGTPKGVMVTHNNIVRLMQATQEWYKYDQQDVWTLFHSYAFDFSVWEIWGALLYGGRLVIVPYTTSRAPDVFYKLLVNEGVTVLNQTPSAFKQLMQVEERLGCDSRLALRYVIFGGEALDLRSLKAWFDRHGDEKPRLINMYGITETTVHVTYRPLSKNDTDSGSMIGVPIPDLKVYILDEYQQPVPVGTPGEICVGGAGVTRGYLNRPELMREKFIPDPFSKEGVLYRSGDLAQRNQNNDIEYLGRIDEQIKIRGFRIELGEIQYVLNTHPAVNNCVVTTNSNKCDTKLIAYVVKREGHEVDSNELRKHLKQKLADYMVPAQYIFIGKIPLTTNGKVSCKDLPKPEIAEIGGISGGIEPKTDLEKRIAEVWQQELGMSKVGVTDNFFDVGGTSLMIVSLQQRLNNVLNCNLMITTLFEYPTISALAQHLSSDKAGSTFSKSLKERAIKQRLAMGRSRNKMRNVEAI
jgi:amino acid adenylation domain-containing protein